MNDQSNNVYDDMSAWTENQGEKKQPIPGSKPISPRIVMPESLAASCSLHIVSLM